MKAWKIKLDSEAKGHSIAKELVGDNLESETLGFTFMVEGGGKEIKKAPMAYVPDLVAKVKQLLECNDR